MRVLVAVGSKHGATLEIGAAIGSTLADMGLHPAVVATDDSERPDDYDAVVLGSAVYAGHWVKSAVEYVERHREALASRPVWLFSSGPIGDPPRPDEEPVDVADIVEATGAIDHRIFAGKMDKGALSFGEKAIALAFRAPEGDFRNWTAIQRWAQEIARKLAAESGTAR
ncbi:MAG TPA: flavodoxin domain-containing protein [Acidimicrobiia bacterium]|jgi:menaquinone-dependent protoporphyrinogen oxidase|nr:flavodoxin domain-containing protein [Acidimicrobiia bacterium]